MGYPVFSRSCRRLGIYGDFMTKAIEIKNLDFSYDGEKKIFEDAFFDAFYGEVLLVAGHSGEGKSTLLSIVSGIIPNITHGELSGTVSIDGEDIKGRRIGYICRKVGVVLQNSDEQIIHKVCDDEIAFGCENLAFPPERIAKQIDTVCTLLKLDKKSNTRSLSGGQKQRLITASTLAMGQRIIVLDEPLANLDAEGTKLLMETLRSLAAAGYAVIVVEHRLDMVLPYVDRVYDVHGGKMQVVTDKKEYLASKSVLISDTAVPHEGKEKFLSLSHVAYSVKHGKDILTDISFDITAGSRNLLLGENGTGKTTLMRLIARLSKPTGGTITQFFDSSLGQKPKGSRAWYKKVGVVYQNPDYQLFMPTVKKEVAFGAVSMDYCEKIMEMFGIAPLADRHPQSLSEGQKRRVSIAAVVAQRPQLLLLDEPTVGQDYEGLKDLVRILNKIHDETQNTMITVTHDRRCAEALCDSAFLIGNGTVLNKGGKQLVKDYFSL